MPVKAKLGRNLGLAQERSEIEMDHLHGAEAQSVDLIGILCDPAYLEYDENTSLWSLLRSGFG